MKNKNREREALKRLLSHFHGDWPYISVAEPTKFDEGTTWVMRNVDDETRDDILYARKLVSDTPENKK